MESAVSSEFVDLLPCVVSFQATSADLPSPYLNHTIILGLLWDQEIIRRRSRFRPDRQAAWNLSMKQQMSTLVYNNMKMIAHIIISFSRLVRLIFRVGTVAYTPYT